jgi:hypothetical protein
MNTALAIGAVVVLIAVVGLAVVAGGNTPPR